MIKNTLGTMAAIAMLAVVPAATANSTPERTKLETIAETAKTPKEHVDVAKQYRLRAEHFERQAQKHETEARRLESAPRSAMAYKWPAMAGQPWVRQRQLAMEAGRAASECLTASDKHMRLSVETLAEAADTGLSRSKTTD